MSNVYYSVLMSIISMSVLYPAEAVDYTACSQREILIIVNLHIDQIQ